MPKAKPKIEYNDSESVLAAILVHRGFSYGGHLYDAADEPRGTENQITAWVRSDGMRVQLEPCASGNGSRWQATTLGPED